VAGNVIGSAFVKVRPDTRGFESTARAGVVGPLKRVAFAGAAVIAAAGIGNAIVTSVKAAANFQQSLSILQATSGATAKQMHAIGAEAIALGNDIHLPAVSAKDAADAMLELSRGGLSVKDTMSAARGVLVLATAAQIDNASAAKITANALQTFNLRGTQAGNVANLLAGAANHSTAEISDMALALQQSGTVAHQFHLSVQTTVGALTELANAGLKGSDAGTSLRTFLQRLIPATKPATAAMKSLGVTIKDAHGNFLPLTRVIDDYRRGLAKLSPVERAHTLQTIFGSDAIRAANIIFGKSGDQLARLTREVNKKGQADALARAQTAGFNGAIGALQSSIETLEIQIGTGLLPVLTTAARRFSGFISDLSKARGFKAKIDVVIGGLDEARKLFQGGIEHLLFGSDQKRFEGGAMRLIHTDGLGEQIASSIRAEIAKTDFTAVGATIGASIGSGIKVTTEALDSILTDALAWVDDHQDAIGAVGAAIAVNLVATLTDPAFWAAHWDAALSIGIALLPEARVVEMGGKFVGFFLKPFAKLGRGIADALAGAFDDALVAVGGRVEAVGAGIGGFVGRGIEKALSGLGGLSTRLLSGFGDVGKGLASLISRGLESAGRSISSGLTRLGASLGDGLVSAVKGAQGLVGRAFVALGDAALATLRGAWGKLGFLTRTAIKAFVVDAIIHGIPGAAAAARNVGVAIVSAIAGALSGLAAAVGHQLDVTASTVAADAGKFVKGAERIAASIANGIKTAPGKLAGLAGDLFSKLSGVASQVAGDAFDAFLGVGKAIIEGVKAGVTSAAKGLGGFIESAVRKAAGISLAPITVPIHVVTSGARRVTHAGGGIIPGNPSLGDVVPALLTAGEVVLNKGQQARVGMGRIMDALRFAGGGFVPRFADGGRASTAGAKGPVVTDALLMNFLKGVQQLPDKIRESLQRAIQAAVDGIHKLQDKLSNAFTQAADDAFQAFDAATAKHLDQIGKRFDGFRNLAESTLGSGLGSAIAHQLRVTMGPAFDALSPKSQQAKIQASQAAFVKDLGKTWSGLPKDVRAALVAGSDAVQAAFDKDIQGYQDTLDAAKDAIASALEDQTSKIKDGLDAQVSAYQDARDATINAAKDWADQQNKIIDDAIDEQVASWRKAQEAAIEAARAALTPTELIVQQEKALHDAASAANDLADAQQKLADAQKAAEDAAAAGDDAGLLDAQQKVAEAQKALDEETYQQKLDRDEAQAQAERDARDKAAQEALDALDAQEKAYRDALEANAQAQRDQIAGQEKAREEQAQGAYEALAAQAQAAADAAIAQAQANADAQLAVAQANYDRDAAARQAAFDKLQAQTEAAHDRIVAELDRQQGREAVEYQASRDLLRRHLTARLAAIEASIETEKDGWAKHSAEVLKVFHQISGDYAEAGRNLGAAFVQGLNESTGALSGAAERLAEAIARYLKLHSPAREGPLSDLHRWWEPFAPTLMRGLDSSAIDDALGRYHPSSYSTLAAGGRDDRIIGRLDKLIRAVEERRPADVTAIVEASDPATMVNKLVAMAGG
jgi:TP901 family phage tail tape measure protein